MDQYEGNAYEEIFTEVNTNSVVPVGYGKMYMDTNMEDLKTKIDSLAQRIYEGVFKWKCTVCGKTTQNKGDIGRHMETHLEGVSHTCNQCGKVSRSSNSLVMHVSTYHRK